MRLARSGPAGSERPIASGPDGVWRYLSGLTDDITGAFLGDRLADARKPWSRDTAARGRTDPVRAAGGRDRQGRVHRAELPRPRRRDRRGDRPPSRSSSSRRPTRWSGPTTTVLIPRGRSRPTGRSSWPSSSARTARYLDSPEDALACVAGYAISHDVSEREFQLERGGQWDKGKNCETFNPLGPWLVTADEVPDPQALALRLWVNGELRQDGTTAEQIFSRGGGRPVRQPVHGAVPGDVINTGTPAGVAWAGRTSRTCGRGTWWSWRSTGSGGSVTPSGRPDMPKPQRIASVIRLRPEHEAEYRRLHADCVARRARGPEGGARAELLDLPARRAALLLPRVRRNGLDGGRRGHRGRRRDAAVVDVHRPVSAAGRQRRPRASGGRRWRRSSTLTEPDIVVATPVVDAHHHLWDLAVRDQDWTRPTRSCTVPTAWPNSNRAAGGRGRRTVLVQTVPCPRRPPNSSVSRRAPW